MEKYDYSELGLKAGLEIHQQLDSKEKLFAGVRPYKGHRGFGL